MNTDCFLYRGFSNRENLLKRTGRRLSFEFFLTVFAWSFIALLFTPLLSSCTTTYAPVEQRSIKPYKSRDYYTKNNRIPEYYTVRKGDTLYSIAWNYGLDYKSLARWNRINSPYTIYVGKKLQLKPSKSSNYNSRASNSRSKKSKGQDSQSASTNSGTNSKQTKSKQSKSKQSKSNKITTSAKTTSYSGSGSTQNKGQNTGNNTNKTQAKKKTYKVTTVTASRSKTAKESSRTYSSNIQLNWAWPVKGQILQRYEPKKGKKGIDIGAGQGTLIKAAETGKVVYSGQGLIGYGLLLIIKHNETFLSAYAHNQSLLVNEGQMVKKGQAIARLGNTGTDRNKLHFEIRKNGHPVNPLSYLP